MLVNYYNKTVIKQIVKLIFKLLALSFIETKFKINANFNTFSIEQLNKEMWTRL